MVTSSLSPPDEQQTAASALLDIYNSPSKRDMNGVHAGAANDEQMSVVKEQSANGVSGEPTEGIASMPPDAGNAANPMEQQPPPLSSPSEKKEEEPPRKSPEKTPRRMSSLNGGPLKQPQLLEPVMNHSEQPFLSLSAPMSGTFVLPAAASQKMATTTTTTAAKPPKKKRHASKTLKDLQKIKSSSAITQFLSTSSTSQQQQQPLVNPLNAMGEGTKINFNQRISVPGSILEIANRVTDGGGGEEDTPKTTEGDTTTTTTALDTTVDSCNSGPEDIFGEFEGSFASKFPSMAEPLSTFVDTSLDEGAYANFLPSVTTKKRRRRDTTDQGGSRDTTKKKKRGQKEQQQQQRKSTDSTSSGFKRSESTTMDDVRILPDPTPRMKQYTIVNDTSPQRIHNPLLTLPQFPMGDSNNNNSTAVGLDEIPTGGELYNMANLCYWDGDTYPISYLGRILGFDIPKSGVGREFVGEGLLDVDGLSVKNRGDDNDAWMNIPNVGKFVNRVWRRDDDDAMLSYRDPLWVDIQQTFRGYNENDFKDAGKGYAAHLSPLVLEFAKDRGVVNGEEVSFRMATADDEAVLRALEDKCQSKCDPKQDLATTLKTPGVFCIIAESAEKVPVAFVQYRFCWYKVEEKKVGTNQMTSYGVKSRAGEGVDKVSELVFFIDNVIYDDAGMSEEAVNPTKQPDVETARVLLMSLALIHAWSHNIWYGMMEAPTSLVPFYTKYFRMIAVGKQADNDETNKSVASLVCDLKKCSFRYAIHAREESLKSKQQAKSSSAATSVNQRMLVHLPDASKPSFSNANNSSESKQVHVRISASQQNGMAPEILSVSAGEGQEATTKVELASLDNVPTEWNAFKLFSTDNPSDTTSSSEEDFFLAELMKKQSELKTLESSIESTSRFLLSEAYNDARDFHLGERKAKKEREKQILKDFEAVKQRLHEADMAWQAQLEQDMDAVCDVCWDGEVTPENQIIFCDSCNVAVHQGCYGIDRVPSGNYFCHPCIHNGKDNEFLAAERQGGARSAPTRTPVICELCPRRQGAFVQSETAPDSLRKPRWVHVGCAKWCGLDYVDIEKKDMIEDVAGTKEMYQLHGHTCALCKSGIGAVHKCRNDKCDKWLHLTCARCVGTCSVQHGENCEGLYPPDSIPYPAWTLACIEHSEVDPETIRKNSITVDQLKAIAKSYPPEPIPPKPFNKMNAKERREYWADRDNLEKFVKKVQSNKLGAFCSVCGFGNVDEHCDKCNTFFHAGCVGTSGQCYGCKYTEEHADSPDYKVPNCKLCKANQGPVLKTYAKPVSMKKWRASKTKMAEFQRSLFGPNTFSHVLCGFWNPSCRNEERAGEDDTIINTTDIVMSHGQGFILDKHRCIVCGFAYGAKVECLEEGCKSGKMHVTCARAAGFEVMHSDDVGFYLRCFQHSQNANNFRARLEDLLEVEIGRSKTKKFDKGFLPMTWDHAASLYHSAVNVLRVLGWAWRWADYWVADADNWEPLIEDDENEEDMTDEQLKKVPSTPESRCEDARKCRLAALGAALRNRDYDKVEGGDEQPLERALKAVLSVPSLVGPLKKKEIEFFTLWLSLAYRSKSPLLGFGDDKIPVADKDFCLHIADGSPKYELGNRPLPGLAEPEHEKTNFEPAVEEVDDFLQTREKPKETDKSKSK